MTQYMSKDTLWESVLSFHQLGTEDQTCPQVWQPVPLPVETFQQLPCSVSHNLILGELVPTGFSLIQTQGPIDLIVQKLYTNGDTHF